MVAIAMMAGQVISVASLATAKETSFPVRTAPSKKVPLKCAVNYPNNLLAIHS
jgi:hypothetical protein